MSESEWFGCRVSSGVSRQLHAVLPFDRPFRRRTSIHRKFVRTTRSARRKRSPAGNYEFDGRDGASYFLSRATLKITTVDAIYSSQTADRGSWDDTRNSVWTDRRSGVERPRPGKIDSSYASYGANSSFGDELSFRKREGNGRGTEGRGLWPGEGSGRYNGARASIIITRLVFGDKMPRDPIGRTHRPDATRI